MKFILYEKASQCLKKKGCRMQKTLHPREHVIRTARQELHIKYKWFYL